MKILNLFLAMLSGAVLVIGGAVSALWLTGNAPWSGDDAPEAPAGPRFTPANIEVRTAIGFPEIEKLMSVAEPTQRAQVLASEEAFQQFVEQEALTQSVIQGAVANGADQNASVTESMHRAAMRVLAQFYLNQIVRLNLDPEFPSDEQLATYFEENQDNFVTPDRVYLWQIFFAAPEGSAEDRVAEQQALANQVATSLRRGESSFADEAARYSGNNQSRLSDGFMGLLRMDDLLPAIREVVVGLDEDEISDPVRSTQGFHILRRGELVESRPITLADVEEEVRTLMRNEAEAQLRQSAADKIRETFPTAFPPDQLASWRKSLQASYGGDPAPVEE